MFIACLSFLFSSVRFDEHFTSSEAIQLHIQFYTLSLNKAGDGALLLKAIEAQHGIFVERANHVYTFSHLTFQEYYTARYIVDNEARGTIRRLINHHITDNRWSEVFLLTASLLDQADEFLDIFHNKMNSLMAADRTIIEIMQWVNDMTLEIKIELKPPAIRTLLLIVLLANMGVRKPSTGGILENILALLCQAKDNNLATFIGGSYISNILYDEYSVTATTRGEDTITANFVSDRGIVFVIDWSLAKVWYITTKDSVIEIFFDIDEKGNTSDTVSNVKNERATYFKGIWSASTIMVGRTDVEIQSLPYKSKWVLSEDQVLNFELYFWSQWLFIECMRLAYTSKRGTLEESLLLPPKAF